MSDSDIKVTDKRMFTPEGELKEEYRFLEERLAQEPAPEEREPAPAAAEPAPPSARSPHSPGSPPSPESPLPPDASPAPPVDLPDASPGLGGPGFLDLVSMMAEPAALYLEEGSEENLQMARLHIDLLAVLREKTRGNLSSQELAFLDDVIYRLRMGYVQSRG